MIFTPRHALISSQLLSALVPTKTCLSPSLARLGSLIHPDKRVSFEAELSIWRTCGAIGVLTAHF